MQEIMPELSPGRASIRVSGVRESTQPNLPDNLFAGQIPAELFHSAASSGFR